MNEAEHIAAIEHDLRQTVEGRGRTSLDDVDSAVLLKELTRLRSQTMDFADVINQLSVSMDESRVTYGIVGLVAHPDLRGYMETSTTMSVLPVEYYKQDGDADYGFCGDSYFPTAYSDGDGGVLYLHVFWTE